MADQALLFTASALDTWFSELTEKTRTVCDLVPSPNVVDAFDTTIAIPTDEFILPGTCLFHGELIAAGTKQPEMAVVYEPKVEITLLPQPFGAAGGAVLDQILIRWEPDVEKIEDPPSDAGGVERLWLHGVCPLLATMTGGFTAAGPGVGGVTPDGTPVFFTSRSFIFGLDGAYFFQIHAKYPAEYDAASVEVLPRLAQLIVARAVLTLGDGSLIDDDGSVVLLNWGSPGIPSDYCSAEGWQRARLGEAIDPS